MKATSIAETPIGQYANEYVILLSFNADGEKVSKVEEFVDSASTKEFFGRLREYVEKSKGEQ